MESAGNDHPIAQADVAATSASGLTSIRIRDVIVTGIVAASIAVLLRIFVLGTFTIPSHSMENTLIPGDQILVSKLPKWFGITPSRGDVVVFTMPDSLRADKPDELYVKRIIGLPTDTVGITPLGITINNKLIPDPPASKVKQAIENGRVQIVVPDGHYFMIGDNRSNSWDSRYWGVLPADHIEGRPLLIYWSYGSVDSTESKHIRWDRLFSTVR
ncbi:MAG: signal peptidase I [Bradyrhizobiaceae bacterium]|nr:signal peptidase I [Bradyrhizobiaceae bacterium]